MCCLHCEPDLFQLFFQHLLEVKSWAYSHKHSVWEERPLMMRNNFHFKRIRLQFISMKLQDGRRSISHGSLLSPHVVSVCITQIASR